MRVAMVGPFPLPGRPVVGGIESVAVNLVEALTGLDVDVHVVTCSADVTRREHRSAGRFEYTILPLPLRRARSTLFALERRAVTSAIKAAAPDVVHIQGTNFYGPAGLAAGLATVVTPHGLHYREAGLTDAASGVAERVSKRVRGLGNARFERITMRRATDLVIISPYVGDAFRPLTRARFHEIPNPLPARFYDVANEPEPGRVLFVGAIEPRKNVLLLVRSFAEVLSAVPQAQLRVVGKPREHEYHSSVMEAMTDPALRGRVSYLGVLSDDELLKEYERAALLVLPSREESSPMSIQQAMAVGLPVVATRAGGIDRLVHDGGTGRLVAPDDQRALAGAVAELLRDPAAARAMGGHGRAVAERFRPEAVAAATLDLYRGLQPA